MNARTNLNASLNAAELAQIAGLIRFSYPCEGGFRREFGSRSEQFEVLFSAKRMEERFKYFEALCLHGLKQQTEKRFTVGVLIGEDMPLIYQARLSDLLASLPQARLFVLPPLPYHRSVKWVFDQLFDQGTPYRLSFRLDDDDSFALDFIEQVVTKLPQLMALSGGLDPVGLSFLKGITLIGPPQARRLVPSVDDTPLGLGLCVLAPKKSSRNALLYSHKKLQTNMPMIMDPVPMMNLRAFHGSNDSCYKLPAGRAIALNGPEMSFVLQRRFGLDKAALLAL